MTNDGQQKDVTYSLAAPPTFAQDGVCFAARNSGLYRSDDAGRTWHSVYDALNLQEPLPTLAVVASPDFKSDQAVFAGAPGGVLRSFDGGASWSVAMLPSPPPIVLSLAISPNFARDGVVLAATAEDGVFRSADRGRTWDAWNFGLLDLNVLCMDISADFAQDETLYVGTETGVFYSTNGGRAWREADFPVEYAPVLSLALSAAFSSDGMLYAGTETRGLFRSGDRGRSWSRLSPESVAEAVNGLVLSRESDAKPHVLAVVGDRLIVSRDGGASWEDWKAGLSFAQGISAVVAPHGLDRGAALLVGLVDGGLRRI